MENWKKRGGVRMIEHRKEADLLASHPMEVIHPMSKPESQKGWRMNLQDSTYFY